MPEHLNQSLTERRAEFVYEAARLAAIAAKAPIVPAIWHEREEPFKAQFRHVIAKQCGPDHSNDPSKLHDDWVEAYKMMGWRYGDVYNPEAKIHPDMVPFDELGRLERDKDSVFVSLCRIARLWIYDQPEIV